MSCWCHCHLFAVFFSGDNSDPFSQLASCLLHHLLFFSSSTCATGASLQISKFVFVSHFLQFSLFLLVFQFQIQRFPPVVIVADVPGFCAIGKTTNDNDYDDEENRRRMNRNQSEVCCVDKKKEKEYSSLSLSPLQAEKSIRHCCGRSSSSSSSSSSLLLSSAVWCRLEHADCRGSSSRSRFHLPAPFRHRFFPPFQYGTLASLIVITSA